MSRGGPHDPDRLDFHVLLILSAFGAMMTCVCLLWLVQRQHKLIAAMV